MTITIKEVAKAAGVAPSTVSRVIADHPSISEKTKQRVRAIMDELHYYPNYNARQLVNQRSKTVGIVLPEANDAFYQNPFFPTALRGINEAASRHQYSLLLSTGDDDISRLDHIKKMIYGKQVDGLIFLYATQNDPILSFVIDEQFPFVIIGNIEGIPMNSIDNDNIRVAKEATEYLWQLGYHRIAFIGGDEKQQFIQQRIKGVQQALQVHGQSLSDADIYNGFPFLENEGYHIMKQIVETNRYNGLVIGDQLVAQGVYHAILEYGLLNEYQLITFKPYEVYQNSDYIHYPYFNLHSQQLADRAMEILIEIISNKSDSKHERFVYELIAGDLVIP